MLFSSMLAIEPYSFNFYISSALTEVKIPLYMLDCLLSMML